MRKQKHLPKRTKTVKEQKTNFSKSLSLDFENTKKKTKGCCTCKRNPAAAKLSDIRDERHTITSQYILCRPCYEQPPKETPRQSVHKNSVHKNKVSIKKTDGRVFMNKWILERKVCTKG